MSEFRPDRIRRIEQLACARATLRAEALGDEGPTPCDATTPPTLRAALAAIDRAVAAGNVGLALALEASLPSSIDADPAIVDRVATLRLLEGDAVTALALLGAVARPTPRLDLLRAIALVALDDADSLSLHLEEISDDPAARPLASIVASIVASALRGDARHDYRDATDGTHHYRDVAPPPTTAHPRPADPTPAFCAILTSAIAARSRPAPALPLTAATLGDAALHELSHLLVAFTAPSALGNRSSSLARRIYDSLEGIARDLGLTHATAHSSTASAGTDDVAIRMSDRRNLPWRVGRPQTPLARPLGPADTSTPSTAIAA